MQMKMDEIDKILEEIESSEDFDKQSFVVHSEDELWQKLREAEENPDNSKTYTYEEVMENLRAHRAHLKVGESNGYDESENYFCK